MKQSKICLGDCANSNEKSIKRQREYNVLKCNNQCLSLLWQISKPYASFFSDESLKSMEVEVEPPDFDEEMLPYVSLYNDADNSVQAVDDYEDGGFGDAGGDD